MANVALEDVRQIVEELFMGYISKIQIPNTKGWYLEYFPNSKETAICFKRMNDVPILQQYITGGYKAEFSFTVSMQASVKDTRHNLGCDICTRDKRRVSESYSYGCEAD